jgi:large subunit ribosomal protein L22
MLKYAREAKPSKSVKVYGRNLRISTKSSAIVCKAISNTSLAKAKKTLENLIAEKQNLNGKYYTKVTKEMLNLVKTAESNAEFKGLDTEKMVTHASAHKGFNYRTPRRFKLARRTGRMTNIQVVLEER